MKKTGVEVQAELKRQSLPNKFVEDILEENKKLGEFMIRDIDEVAEETLFEKLRNRLQLPYHVLGRLLQKEDITKKTIEIAFHSFDDIKTLISELENRDQGIKTPKPPKMIKNIYKPKTKEDGKPKK